VIAERVDLRREFLAAREHVLAFVLALTRSRDVAEEVVQELSVHVLRQAERGGAEPDDPLAWMLGAARNRVADYYRARTRDERNLKRLMAMAAEFEAAFVENPPALPEEAGAGGPVDEHHDPRVSHLRTCLEKLSAKTRLMLDARYARAASIEAIATKLSWTPGSVKVALSKARRALGECVRRKLAIQGVGRG
jgi:RNA polymerase sigma-70 factor (ECF subfamily)